MTQSLTDYVRTAGQIPVDDAVAITRSLLSDLEVLHSRGDVHGAICPDAIDVDEDGSVHLRGIVEDADPGSPDLAPYAAPEVGAGQPATRSSDTYSLGCVLSMLLTGRPPFAAATVDDVARQHRETSPPPVHLARFDVPVRVEEVVSQSLDKDPAARFSSAGHMDAALEAAMANHTEVLAAPPLRDVTYERSAAMVDPVTEPRNPIVWAGIALLALLAIVAGIWFASSRRSPEATPTPLVVTPIPTVPVAPQPAPVVVPPSVIVVTAPPQATAAPTPTPTPTPLPTPSPTP